MRTTRRNDHRAYNRVRKQCVEDRLAAPMDRRARSRVYGRKVDEAREARLLALACGAPPAGLSS